jgi:hypothetical protein
MRYLGIDEACHSRVISMILGSLQIFNVAHKLSISSYFVMGELWFSVSSKAYDS